MASSNSSGADFLSNYSFSWATLPVWLVVVESVLIVAAVAGNSWILCLGILRPQLRRSTFHLLLLNYSAAIFLLSSFVYPSFTFRLHTGLASNRSQIELCRFSSLGLLWFMATALFTNGFLALNRALSCYPLLPISSTIRSRRTTLVGIVVIWVTAFFIYGIPALVGEQSFLDIFMCKDLEGVVANILSGKDPLQLQPWKTIVSYEMSSTMLLTLLVNAASYSTIVRYLLQNHAGSVVSEQRKREKKRALFIVVVLFVVLLTCTVPLLCALIIDPILIARNHVYLFMPLVEAAVDPILYMVTMPAFRPHWMPSKGRRDSSAVIVTQASHVVPLGQLKATY